MEFNQDIPQIGRNGSSVTITADNRGGAVNLANWICTVSMCLVVLLKVVSKVVRAHPHVKIQVLNVDDYSLLFAMVFAIFESVAVTKQVDAGLGQHQGALTLGQIRTFEKAGYASQLFYVPAILLSKTASMFLIMILSRRPWHKVMIGTIAFTAVWLVISLLTVAFQCHLPSPWKIISSACSNQSAFWISFGTVDVTLVIVLVVFPICMLRKLQAPWAKKSAVFAVFAIRIIEIPITIIRTLYIRQTSTMADQTSAEWRVSVVTAVSINVSIILSCIPYLKPFINNLQAGWSASNVHTGLGFVSKNAHTIATNLAIKQPTKHASNPVMLSSNSIQTLLQQSPQPPATGIKRTTEYFIRHETA